MKLGGKCLIGMGLLLFGITKWWIPAACIVGGIAAIKISDEFKL